MREYFPKPNSLGTNVTKIDFKNATGVDTSKFAKKVDLANFKSNVDNFGMGALL